MFYLFIIILLCIFAFMFLRSRKRRALDVYSQYADICSICKFSKGSDCTNAKAITSIDFLDMRRRFVENGSTPQYGLVRELLAKESKDITKCKFYLKQTP